MKKYPFVKQTGLRDCGPACIQMILKYYGGYMSKDKLSILLETNSRGTNIYKMIECLKTIGFDSDAYYYEDIKKIKTPCIVHTKQDIYNHYIVIYEINLKKKHLIIGDPSKKILKTTFKEFNSYWTGNTIIMKPVRKITKEEEPKALKFIINLLKLNKSYLLFIGLLSIFICFLSIVSTLLIQKIVNNNHLILASTFLITLLIKNLFIFIKNQILIKMNNKVDKKLLTDTFDKIIYLPYIYSKNKTSGELISYFNDLYKVKDLFSFIEFLLINIPLIITTTIIIVFINLKMFISNLLIIILYIIAYLYFHKRNYYLTDEIIRKKAMINSYITENINGYKTINNLNIQDKVIKKFKEKYNNYNNLNIKYEKTQNKELYIKNNITSFSFFIILIYGLIYKNNIITIYFLITLLNTSIIELLEYEEKISNIVISIKHIQELKTIKKEKTNKANNIKIKNLNKRFNHKKVLSNINLSINKGEKIFVTGKSGSGKSTLFKIIKGYYDSEGTCQIDDYDPYKYYSNVKYISPDETLFTGRIIDNLSIDTYNIINKKICEIEEFNDEEIVYENGFNLSTGQKQRIALARSLNNFDVLIIDEGLDGIDTNMERRIIKNLKKNYKEKTIIYISHRLDNLDLFDRMIKIDAGRIIFDEKKQKGSIYETQ